MTKEFRGKGLRWEWRDSVVELTLDYEPLNEIGLTMLAYLEKFAAAIKVLAPSTSACIITSARPGGFCAGADLKELYYSALPLSRPKRIAGVRAFLKRIHRVLNALDAAPFVTFAAVQGLCMGGGLEDQTVRTRADALILSGRARAAKQLFPRVEFG